MCSSVRHCLLLILLFDLKFSISIVEMCDRHVWQITEALAMDDVIQLDNWDSLSKN